MSVHPANGPSGARSGWADVIDLTVVRAGALGDFLVTLPALRALARPGRRLRLVGNPAARILAPDLLGEVASFDQARWAGLFHDGVPLPAPTGGAIVLLKQHPDAAARLARAGFEPVLGASPYPRPDSDRHVAEHLLEAVAPALDRAPLGLVRTGADPARPGGDLPGRRTDDVGPGSAGRWLGTRPLIEPPAGASHAAAERLARLRVGGAYAVIHPGSGSARKNWPVARFAELARQIERAGARPLVLVGPADASSGAALAAGGAWPVVDGLGLGELAGLLAGAVLCVGNDSGVSHLAGVVGAPTVAIFGPTRALRWRPLGPRVASVEPSARCALCAAAEERPVDCDCIGRVEVDAVVEAARTVAGAPGRVTLGLAL